MKRVKTKHKDAGRRKLIKLATEDAVGYMLLLCYAAMKDEFNLSAEDCRAWKKRLDRYAGYMADKTLDLQDLRDDLQQMGLEV